MRLQNVQTLSAQRDGGGPDGGTIAGVNVNQADEFLTGAALEDLLGICVGAEYMLEVNVFALAE